MIGWFKAKPPVEPPKLVELVFEPARDITAFELAEILMGASVSGDVHAVMADRLVAFEGDRSVLRDDGTPVSRHFRRIVGES